MPFPFGGTINAGILLASIISWPRVTMVTYFPYTETGDSAIDFLNQVVASRLFKNVLAAQDRSTSDHGGQFAVHFITFLYVDIPVGAGTMYAMARYCGAIDERSRDFEGSLGCG